MVAGVEVGGNKTHRPAAPQGQQVEQKVLVDLESRVKAHRPDHLGLVDFIVRGRELAGGHQIPLELVRQVGEAFVSRIRQGRLRGIADVLHPEEQHVRAVFQDGQRGLIQAGQHPVVRVHKLQIAPGGGVQARVAGGAGPGIFLMDHPHPAVLLGKPVAQRAAAVRAAVVH